MARATNSLPVPLSPVINTGTSQAANLRIWSNTSRITVLLPTMKTVGEAGGEAGNESGTSSPQALEISDASGAAPF
jgi:hypothetical protein